MAKFSFFDFLEIPGKIYILDIGAAVLKSGPERYAALLAADRAHVYACEPDAAARAELGRHYPKNLTVLPDILGDGKPATWHETNCAPTSSLFEPNRELLDLFPSIGDFTRLLKATRVETKRLDDCAGIADCDFIKIDVQGAEIQVLANGPAVLKKCMVIQTEVCFMPLYRRQPLFGDIDLFMRANGYLFHTLAGAAARPIVPMPFADVRRPWMNQFAWGDAVYVRDFTRLDALTTEKQLKLAALLHEFWDSYDLAAFVLGEADKRLGTHHQADYVMRLSESGLL